MKKLASFIHNLFVPSENNNFRARVLHHDFLTFYLLISLFLVFSIKAFNNPFGNVLGFATDITVTKLYQLTNLERQKYNIPSLTYNEKLAQAAKEKAHDMFSNNYWSHYAPDGKTPWNFIYSAGYQYEYAGENLAKNFLFSQNVVDAWMDSSTHKENVLRKEYTDVGFAVVNGVLNGEETTLVVQIFGKPLYAGKITAKNIPGDLAGLKIEGQRSTIRSPSSFNTFWFFIGFLGVTLTADLYFASKMNLVRFHGKNIAHIIFLIFISLGVIFFISKGAIL